MNIKKTLRIAFATVGVVILFFVFTVTNPLVNSIFIICALFCALVPHFLVENLNELSEEVPKPRGVIQRGQLPPIEDVPPLPPPRPAAKPSFPVAPEKAEPETSKFEEAPEEKPKPKNLKFCSDCGAKNKKSARYCVGCAERL